MPWLRSRSIWRLRERLLVVIGLLADLDAGQPQVEFSSGGPGGQGGNDPEADPETGGC